MLFSPLLARLRKLGLVFTTPVFMLSACATPIVYNRPASDCSALIPPTLRDDTEGAALPVDQTVGSWVVFGDAQTGQLDKANVTKRASIQVVEACEKRDREAAAKVTKRPWWAIFG
ncbi:hypothetical protein [Novosphingobium lindaniclasticum]|uniref:Uncharacterized protein n=1 Tax=Novosphingobium lindaniclasticum LE124 TaxID=1096930 RepID=T0HBN2_9SPHN|nr:hypothetical protein [Novosphingobium lindaniclasticum]EQB10407.1 hypothetical protein L284_17090 [Novosphingobium lindaniclasticum LE124]